MTCPHQDVNVELGTDVAVSIETPDTLVMARDLVLGQIIIANVSPCAEGSVVAAAASAVAAHALYNGQYDYDGVITYGG